MNLKVFWNSKWSGLFLESFRGQMLLKNKVKWLDLASRVWPPLVGLPLAKMVQVHYDFMVKYSKPQLSSSSKKYYWSSNIWVMIMAMFAIFNLL